MGQMDLTVNFCDNVANKMCTRYLDYAFIGHARHQDLYQHFISAMSSLDLRELLQVFMDGPNVNWDFLSELQSYRTENGISTLV